jgi:hypothetical protein
MNIKCCCNKYLSDDTELIVLILPCNHFVYEKCLNKSLLENNKKCLICNSEINLLMTEENIKKSNNKQHKINLKSIKHNSTDIIADYTLYPKYILKFNTIFNKLISSKTFEDLLATTELILKFANIKINLNDNTKKNPIIYKNKKISWVNKKDEDCKKIIICNHSNLIDSFILFYFFQCGFISSDVINKIEIGRIITEKIKLLVFKRNDKASGTVDKIKEYLEIYKKIVIFPQGFISHGKTISKFRSGAFYSCDTICPVTVKFEPCIDEPNMKDYYYKILTQDVINVNITINDFEYGEFNDEKIEKIRIKMAKQLKYDLSDITTKGLKD